MSQVYFKHKILQPNPLFRSKHNLPPITNSQQEFGLLNYIEKATAIAKQDSQDSSVKLDKIDILDQNLSFIENRIKNDYYLFRSYNKYQLLQKLSSEQVQNMLKNATNVSDNPSGLIRSLVYEKHRVLQPDLSNMTPAYRSVLLLNYIEKAACYVKHDGKVKVCKLDLNPINESLIYEIIRQDPNSYSNKLLEKNYKKEVTITKQHIDM